MDTRLSAGEECRTSLMSCQGPSCPTRTWRVPLTFTDNADVHGKAVQKDGELAVPTGNTIPSGMMRSCSTKLRHHP